MFSGFEEKDFELFDIEGLESRMEELKMQLRPKFEQMGTDLSEQLSEITNAEVYSHVAKHARRKTNPPDDSWVAFAENKRGYKMMPHFQVTVWKTHVLIQWGIIYEAKSKEKFANELRNNLDYVKKEIPDNFQWSKDHMKPEGKLQGNMADSDFDELIERLLHHKKGEVMVGLPLKREQVLKMSSEEFYKTVLQTWKILNQLHQMAK